MRKVLRNRYCHQLPCLWPLVGRYYYFKGYTNTQWTCPSHRFVNVESGREATSRLSVWVEQNAIASASSLWSRYTTHILNQSFITTRRQKSTKTLHPPISLGRSKAVVVAPIHTFYTSQPELSVTREVVKICPWPRGIFVHHTCSCSSQTNHSFIGWSKGVRSVIGRAKEVGTEVPCPLISGAVAS